MLWWLACAPAEEDTGPEPEWSASEVEDGLAAALAYHLPAFPLVSRTWDELSSHGDGLCPPTPNGFDIIGGAGCTSEDGYTFSGIAGHVDGWNGSSFVFQVYGDFVITDAAGRHFSVGGSNTAIVDEKDGTTTLQHTFLGSMQYEDGEAWLADGTSAAAWIEATIAEDGATSVHLEGGYRVGPWSIYFDDVTVADGCATGSTRLRDDRGYWYDLAYENCACGPVTFEGTDLGSACADLGDEAAKLVSEGIGHFPE
jgi:hypothetical protein